MTVERFYSAEEAAEVLGLQVRTVRGYIRDGRLRAVRIGKQYRVAEADLARFVGGIGIESESSVRSADRREGVTRGLRANPPTVSDNGIFTLVDIQDMTFERVDQLKQTVVAAVGEKGVRDPDLGLGTVDYTYDVDRGHLRLMISGTAAYIIRILRLVQGLTEERGNLETRIGRPRL